MIDFALPDVVVGLAVSRSRHRRRSSARPPNRQEHYRREYRARRPRWRDSATLLRDLVEETAAADAQILDVGCGRKGVIGSLARRERRFYGVDPDRTALVRNTIVEHRVAGTGDRLPFADESFDVVVSAWVAEHLEHPARVAREASRVLRPGGALLLLTPNAWNYATWIIRAVPNRLHAPLAGRMWGRAGADTYPVRYRLNSPRRMTAVLEHAGLTRERIVLNGDPTYVAFGDRSFAVACAIERVLEHPRLALGRAHLIAVFRKPR